MSFGVVKGLNLDVVVILGLFCVFQNENFGVQYMFVDIVVDNFIIEVVEDQ